MAVNDYSLGGNTPARKTRAASVGLACLPLGFCLGWLAHPAFNPAPAVSEKSAPDPDPSRIQAYFSPRGGARDAIIDCIDQAKTENVNAENTLVFKSDRGLAEEYRRLFETLRERSDEWSS